MVLFACDWCNKIKEPGETWILGLAAEAVGLTAARREVNILTGWTDAHACDRLAVHFCSPDHKDSYMAALFDAGPLPAAETVVETTTTAIRPGQRKYVRATGSAGSKTGKKKSAAKKRRRAA